ncbi:MAG TPA: hypothetical protein VKU02_00425 [Gemmataceae bacterium]|nr:hypothetical protein [Gemmataceae bacterium]
MPPTADYVLILPDADRRYDWAARLYDAGTARGVLLVERYPLRLERLGYCMTFEMYSQRELAARGVPATAITVIPGQRRTDWDRARGLRDWLEQHPTVQILALCDRYGGRKLRYVLDSVLGAEVARRIRLMSLPERDYDESNWWQQRIAVVHIFDAYVNLAYTRLLGEETEEWREWDPDQFKKSLR